ncbi:hypothetical protein Thimo_3458 [Thioflavicoccus mobilis 8321]|uniref:Uncharacterized protein n=1 Tax=Thioflavicoccus mobilis 8321 TaxID=765912 RepID=L0H253_9GAMM|nr:hypothetical protein Thimo_3458 [Thioflavicoccus mobilis 8321]
MLGHDEIDVGADLTSAVGYEKRRTKNADQSQVRFQADVAGLPERQRTGQMSRARSTGGAKPQVTA